MRKAECGSGHYLVLVNILNNFAEEDPELNKIENYWNNSKEPLQICPKYIGGETDRKNKEPWFEKECKAKISQRNQTKETCLIKKAQRNR